MNIPEPSLHPAEPQIPPLICTLCRRPVESALEVLRGPVCRSCLQTYAHCRTMEDLSSLFCAAILTDQHE